MSQQSQGFFARLHNRPRDLLPVSTYVGYGAGQIGGQILRDTPALILPIYMTTVLGLEAALAGLVIIIAKIWVVVADPIAGVISDKTTTRWGRRRPFILAVGLLDGDGFLGWRRGDRRQLTACRRDAPGRGRTEQHEDRDASHRMTSVGPPAGDREAKACRGIKVVRNDSRRVGYFYLNSAWNVTHCHSTRHP